jgi:hypothetical protein
MTRPIKFLPKSRNFSDNIFMTAPNTQTPFALDAPRPSDFLAVTAWPTFPADGLLREQATKADLKAIQSFRDRLGKAKELHHENDFARFREQAHSLSLHGGPNGYRRAEEFHRKAELCDMRAFQAADTEIQTVDSEARQFASDFCKRAGQNIYETVFLPELAQAEARCERFGQALSEQFNSDRGSVTVWRLHGDDLLAGLYYSAWCLVNYFAEQYVQPTIHAGSPMGLDDLFQRVAP